MAIQHGRDHENRWFHKDHGVSHSARSDLDPDEETLGGITKKDAEGRPTKIRKRNPHSRI